jgi:pilus assembly protein CpaE
MEVRPTTSALISPDSAFRDMLRQAVARSGHSIAVGYELAGSPAEMDAAAVAELQRINPELVFLDMNPDPSIAIRFAQFLTDSNPRRQFIAVGPTLQPELLMEAMRAGISEYLPRPITPEALSAALDRTTRKLNPPVITQEERTSGKLWVTFSVKGGSGATTVATNLAIRVRKLSGKKTLLLDLNLELGEAALFLGMQPQYTFVDVIQNLHRMDADLLTSYIEQHDSGVHLLAAPLDPGAMEALTGNSIAHLLGFLREHYDYIIVDTSRTLARVTPTALEQADEVLLVATADLPSIRNIKHALPLLERIAGKDKIRLIVNRYQVDDLIPLKEVQSTLGIAAYATLANDYEAVIRSINTGNPVALDGKSRFNSDVGALGARIAGAEFPQSGRKGPLGSLKNLFRRKGVE